MSRYRVFKKDDKVQIIASTYDPSDRTEHFARRKRQGRISRRIRNRGSGAPIYHVAVTEEAYWGGRETNIYAFNPSDLKLWSER